MALYQLVKFGGCALSICAFFSLCIIKNCAKAIHVFKTSYRYEKLQNRNAVYWGVIRNGFCY